MTETYKVWHRTTPTFMADPLASDEFPKGFTHVADVTTDQGPFQCFELTNHIDHPWWDNAGVVKVVAAQVRSTSVGDAVETPSGAVYVVLGCGWEQIRTYTRPWAIA